MTFRKVSCFVLFAGPLLLGSPKMLSWTQREGGVGSYTKALVPAAPVSNMSPCTLTADGTDPQAPFPPVMIADGTDPQPPFPWPVRAA
jgi:hypothetical protein